MAAAYLFYIVQNHPFIDGNKRVGLEAALLFLEINGVSVEASDEALSI
jgi:death on curing protein